MFYFMLLIVARQLGIYVIGVTLGVTVGTYGPKYVNNTTIKIICDLMSGGL